MACVEPVLRAERRQRAVLSRIRMLFTGTSRPINSDVRRRGFRFRHPILH